MQLARPLFALDPKRFGRGPVRQFATAKREASALASDLALFATTFAAGFLVTSILIA
jgi:hypothetical protein